MNRFTIRIVALLVLLGASVAVMKYPDIHHRYLFPMSRLYRSVYPGESYDEVRARFLEYYRERIGAGAAPAVRFEAGVRERDFAGNPVETSEYLDMIDASPFATLHLGVLFDDTGRVSHIHYAAQ